MTEKIGSIASVWRYPVKGMRGEELGEGFVGFAGLYGDRMYAFRSPAAPKGFPYHTAREQEDLLLYRPRFRDSEAAAKPPNLAEAECMAPGITPIFAEREGFAVEVAGPDGRVIPIDDSDLLETVRKSRDDEGDVHLVFSERPLTDCRPVSVFALATARQIGEELGQSMDPRRFRANLYVELDAGEGFAEDALVGKRIRIGDKVELAILDRDPRCKMIALDPETGDHDPMVLRHVTTAHEGKAGLYAAVLVEGLVRPGDFISLVTPT